MKLSHNSTRRKISYTTRNGCKTYKGGNMNAAMKRTEALDRSRGLSTDFGER